jgi:c-di-AMP phosphodiesterase-like protein
MRRSTWLPMVKAATAVVPSGVSATSLANTKVRAVAEQALEGGGHTDAQHAVSEVSIEEVRGPGQHLQRAAAALEQHEPEHNAAGPTQHAAHGGAGHAKGR